MGETRVRSKRTPEARMAVTLRATRASSEALRTVAVLVPLLWRRVGFMPGDRRRRR